MKIEPKLHIFLKICEFYGKTTRNIKIAHQNLKNNENCILV